ncbi:hypothetical protein F4820DRAFT_466207 [Hypoxylon rubiginosum]|uniref:Uncharacterized protein n=1 Tax=Hypoxylon rubiginosum TaxID=110542 RepID=A0ACB9YL18_9PEZI|nr:hypothetical protein F4820DRAFT_466207 [Hypoxylon rubiginosum]
MAELQPQQMRIPLELVFKVMTCLLLTNENAIIPQSHPATQILLAFSTVSRATHEEATKKLKQHCLYIANPRRVACFARCLQSWKWTSNSPSVFQGITDLFLCIPNTPGSRFPVYILFNHIGPSLRRATLEWKLPLPLGVREHEPANDAITRGILSMVNLEELICDISFFNLVARTADFPRSDSMEVLPALKRLGIYGTLSWYTDAHNLPNFPSIEHIVVMKTNISSDVIFSHLSFELRQQQSKEPVKVVAVVLDHPFYLQQWFVPCRQWAEKTSKGCFFVTKHLVPMENFNGGFWRRTALAGELWDLGSDEQDNELE